MTLRLQALGATALLVAAGLLSHATWDPLPVHPVAAVSLGLVWVAATASWGGLVAGSVSALAVVAYLIGVGLVAAQAATAGPLLAAAAGVSLLVSWHRGQGAALGPERAAHRQTLQRLEDLPAVIWDCDVDRDGSIVSFGYVGAGAQELLGRAPRDWRARPASFWTAVHPDDVDVLREALNRTRSGEQHVDLEIRMLSGPGDITWMSGRLSRIRQEVSGSSTIRAHLVETTRRRRGERRLALSGRARSAALSAPAPEDVPAAVLQAVCQAGGWDVGTLWTPDDTGRGLCCTASWTRDRGTYRELLESSSSARIPAGAALPGRAWSDGKSQALSDVTGSRDERYVLAARSGLRGAVAFTLRGPSGPVAAIEVLGRDPEPGDPELMDALASLGREIGELVESRRRAEEVARRRALLESVTTETLDGILVVSADNEVMSCNARLVELFDLPDNTIGSPVSSLPASVAHLVGEQGPGDQPLRCETDLEDGRCLDVWSAPLNGGSDRVWYFRDITTHKQVQKDLTESRERVRLLADAGQVLGSSLDTQETVDQIPTLLVPGVADWAVVHLVTAGGSPFAAAAAHADPGRRAVLDELLAAHPALLDSPSGPVYVIRNAQPVFHESVDAELLREWTSDSDHARMLSDLQVGSLAVVPLQIRDRTLGSLTVGTSGPDRVLGKEAFALAEALAHRASLALDNARLFQERSHIAQVLQESLLPPVLPTIPGVRIGTAYRAAGEGHEVGGDFYDMFECGPSRWAIVIGDVAGKGAEAAALTGLVRYTVRSEAMQQREPTGIVSVLNEALLDQAEPEQFCTLTYMRVDHRRGEVSLTIVSAGHPAPLLTSPEGVREVGIPGSSVGITPDPEFVDDLVLLQEGEKLVLFTDGLAEARSPSGEVFGEERLQSLVRELRDQEEQAMADRIMDDVLAFTGGNPRDDIALIVLGR